MILTYRQRRSISSISTSDTAPSCSSRRSSLGAQRYHQEFWSWPDVGPCAAIGTVPYHVSVKAVEDHCIIFTLCAHSCGSASIGLCQSVCNRTGITLCSRQTRASNSKELCEIATAGLQTTMDVSGDLGNERALNFLAPGVVRRSGGLKVRKLTLAPCWTGCDLTAATLCHHPCYLQ